MKLLIALILTLNTGICAASSSSDDSELLDKAAQVGVRTFVTDVTKDYLNHAVTTLPGVGGSVSGVGNKVFLIVGLALATDELLKAKSDKQRVYATAEAASAVLTYACAPAGLIATAALLGARIVDGALDAEADQLMMALYQEAANFIKKANDLQNMDTVADKETILLANQNNELASKKVTELRENISKSCTDRTKLSDYSTLDNCLSFYAQILTQKQILVGYSDVLLNFKSPYFNADAAFIYNKTTRAEFQKLAQSNRADLEVEKAHLKNMVVEMGQLTAELIRKKAESEGGFSPSEQSEAACSEDALDLANASESALYARSGARANAQAAIDLVTLPVLMQKMDLFELSDCTKLESKRLGVNDAIALFKTQYSRFKHEVIL